MEMTTRNAALGFVILAIAVLLILLIVNKQAVFSYLGIDQIISTRFV